MTNTQAQIHHAFKQFSKLLQEDSVRVASRNVIGILIPLVIAILMDKERQGIEMMLGVILISFADVREPLKDKMVSFGISLCLIVSLTFLICLSAQQYWLLLPILFVVIFILSYFAPFGARFGSIAFSGTIAIIISISTYKVYQELPKLIEHVLHLLAGGIWYIVYALMISIVTFKVQARELVTAGIEETIQYLKLRVGLMHSDKPLFKGLLALSEQQANLTSAHGEIREFLLQDISQIRKAKSYSRRLLLIFVEQLELMEAALATPLEYSSWHVWLKKYPELEVIPRISQLGIKELERMTILLNRGAVPDSYQPQLEQLLNESATIQHQLQKKAGGNEDVQKLLRHASNVTIYQKVQLQKLRTMEGIIQGSIDQAEQSLNEENHHQFLNQNLPNWERIKENFTFQSSYFRYALRTTVTAVLGFILGRVLGLENAYWVMLTVLVVMKPGFTVTRQRFINRIGGTILGALIAYGFYLINPSHGISLMIFAMAFFIGKSFVPHYYFVSSIFFTIYVVFLYSFLHKEIPSAVIYRVVDTTLGASMCYVSLFLLWPSWEHQSFPQFLFKSMRANQRLLVQIINKTQGTESDLTAYRLARKNAYVQMANSVSSYQRFRTEPKSKQLSAVRFGDMLLLNYQLQATIFTIGVYLNRYQLAESTLQSLQYRFHEICQRFSQMISELSGNVEEDEEGCVPQHTGHQDDLLNQLNTSQDQDAFEFLNGQLALMGEYLNRLKEVGSKEDEVVQEMNSDTVLQ